MTTSVLKVNDLLGQPKEVVTCGACAFDDKGICRHPYFSMHEVRADDYCSLGERDDEE